MPLRLAYGETLGLSGGVPASSSPFVYVARRGTALDADRARLLLIQVEPVELTADTDMVAEQVVATLLARVENCPAKQATARLCEAVDLANDIVLNLNRARFGPRRTLLGLTCVVACGDRLLAAHLPPAQFAIRQDGDLVSFPPISGWTSNVRFNDASFANPLGLRDRTEPVLTRTALAPGDMLLGIATNIAPLLASSQQTLALAPDPDSALTIVGEACDRALLVNSAIGIVGVASDRRGTPARQDNEVTRGVSNTHPESIPIGAGTRWRAPAAARSPAPIALDPNGRARQTGVAHDEPDSFGTDPPVEPGAVAATPVSAAMQQTDEWPIVRTDACDDGTLHGDGGEREARGDGEGQRSSAPAGMDPYLPATVPVVIVFQLALSIEGRGSVFGGFSAPRAFAMTNIVAGLLVSLVATVVGVWTVARRDRPLHGPRDDNTLRLPRLQRWDVSYKPQRFQRIRSGLPHLESGRIVVFGIATIVLLIAGMYAISRLHNQPVANSEEFEQEFQLVLARHADAQNQSDLPTAYAILIEAQTRLEDLADKLPDGAVDSRVEQERAALQTELDHLANAIRFSTVNVVGSVPAAPAGVEARLFLGGGRVFLLSDALYQVDAANTTLVRLIASGDTIGDQTVGTIRGAVWRGDRPVVVDETSAWNLDPATGVWSREALGTFDNTGYVDVGAVESFEQNLYMLTPESGQILKFEAGSYGSSPDDWAEGVPSDDLASAVDIAIDGRIWALRLDGSVLSLFRSRVEADLEPVYVPPLDSAIALVANPNSPYLYVLNADDGRIIRLARDGRVLQQFTTPAGSASFAKARDFVVDEGTGVAFVLAANTIYSVRIPQP